MKVEDLQRYYHGTRTEFAIGERLFAQPDGYAVGDAYMTASEKRLQRRLEAAIDKYRPSGVVPRVKAFYMVRCDSLEQAIKEVDWAGGYLDFVYEVEPLTPPHVCNMYWYTVLEEGSLMDANRLKDERWVAENATRYWNAQPGERTLFEYLTTAATVTRLVHSED